MNNSIKILIVFIITAFNGIFGYFCDSRSINDTVLCSLALLVPFGVLASSKPVISIKTDNSKKQGVILSAVFAVALIGTVIGYRLGASFVLLPMVTVLVSAVGSVYSAVAAKWENKCPKSFIAIKAILLSLLAVAGLSSAVGVVRMIIVYLKKAEHFGLTAALLLIPMVLLGTIALFMLCKLKDKGVQKSLSKKLAFVITFVFAISMVLTVKSGVMPTSSAFTAPAGAAYMSASGDTELCVVYSAKGITKLYDYGEFYDLLHKWKMNNKIETIDGERYSVCFDFYGGFRVAVFTPIDAD